jgi:hypothetical protein
MENGEWRMENWVERAGDLNRTLTITTIHLKGGEFKPLFFVNWGKVVLNVLRIRLVLRR